MTATAILHCGNCPHYLAEAAALESALPGFNILSSAFGSVRDETGLCRRFEIFVVPATGCIADARGDASRGYVERR